MQRRLPCRVVAAYLKFRLFGQGCQRGRLAVGCVYVSSAPKITIAMALGFQPAKGIGTDAAPARADLFLGCSVEKVRLSLALQRHAVDARYQLNPLSFFITVVGS